MKWLIFLFIVTACGNHTQPAGKDIRDRDGDQIMDGEEVGMNKFIANITPLENVQMIVKLKGSAGPGVNFENCIDVAKYSKDLLVKNKIRIPKDDYFGEWSKLTRKQGSLPIGENEYRYILKLSFNKLQTMPTLLHLRSSEGIILTFKWMKEMEIELTKDEYKNLQDNTYTFSLSRSDKLNPAYQMSQQESVKRNTYRVLMNNGESTNIYYVANELSFEAFLKEINVTEVFDIDMMNILTTSHSHHLSQWWVRTLNEKDKVLVKDDLKNISNYRLQGFNKDIHKLGRQNGYSQNQLKVEKHAYAEVLLKIRAEQQMRTFSTRYETKVVGSLAREGYKIKYEIIDYLPSTNEVVPANQILSNITIDGNPLLNNKDVMIHFMTGEDKLGTYVEVIIKTERTDFILNVPSLDLDSYRPTGVVRRRIGDDRWENMSGTVTNPEGYFNLLIDAYIEKL
jgi:hypothetical protein